MDVDLEIGGNDQMFNMLCGRDLMKAIKGKEKFVLTLKLLADDTGKKMGKTEGNVVNLNETPENMFGQIMAWSDGLINPGFELCTNLAENVVAEIREKMKDPANNPRDFKLQLAYEITKINHGEEAAKKAQENFIKTFSQRETPEDIPEHIVKWCEPLNSYQNVIDFIVSAGFAKSRGDARRKIEQGGVWIEGEGTIGVRILSKELDDGKVMRVGKKDFVKIKFEK
jgi:tyrosyl-tRNA synthetase